MSLGMERCGVQSCTGSWALPLSPGSRICDLDIFREETLSSGRSATLLTSFQMFLLLLFLQLLTWGGRVLQHPPALVPPRVSQSRASSTTDSSQAVSKQRGGGAFYLSLDRVICGNCLQAAVESQEEEKAEGSWHSIFRKLCLSSLGSLSEGLRPQQGGRELDFRKD